MLQDHIVHSYHQLLMLDNDTDKEKKWIDDQIPEAAGLSTIHFHILSYLENQPDSLAKQISQALGILPGTLSKRLTLLERRQLIVNHRDANDSRSKHYRLTELGNRIAQVHDQLLVMKNGMLKQSLAEFSPEELETIQRFLDAFVAAEEHDQYPRR